jgi:hypothetical protein
MCPFALIAIYLSLSASVFQRLYLWGNGDAAGSETDLFLPYDTFVGERLYTSDKKAGVLMSTG